MRNNGIVRIVITTGIAIITGTVTVIMVTAGTAIASGAGDATAGMCGGTAIAFASVANESFSHQEKPRLCPGLFFTRGANGRLGRGNKILIDLTHGSNFDTTLGKCFPKSAIFLFSGRAD